MVGSEAQIVERSMPAGVRDALEQGWLLRELVDRFGLGKMSWAALRQKQAG